MRIYSIYKYLFLMTLSLTFPVTVGAQTESAPQPATQLDFRNGTVFEVNPYTGAMGGSGLFGMRLGMNYGSSNWNWGWRKSSANRRICIR
ncbi:MAG: hypothetical protein R3C41_07275 [Calditrichia bacterium]